MNCSCPQLIASLLWLVCDMIERMIFKVQLEADGYANQLSE